ncbi:MAG: multicopper oxidase domain-containing protein, partial [Gammaproteobacteria bacterium]|nr:multicopper oxidase domain-containing protein [Gammaproteobacteria bacterium]
MKTFRTMAAAALLAALSANGARAALVEYAFDIDTITVHFTGKPAQAIAVGGQIPAPTIEAAVGDTLRVTFRNRLDEESSVHWHGILLPNDQDGVPWLTTQPIAPGASFTYQYKVTHAGTYWYHSHSGLQEQRGIYGALIFHPEKETVAAERDYAVVLSDWTDEAPARVLRNLKKDGDYYARKKNTVQSWAGVAARGWPAVKNRLHGAWIRMGPMDPSDVGYDLFLANGKREQTLAADAGERVRLRLINAAASSYFDVEFAGGPMTVVAADGVDVEPRKVQRLRIAIAETWDVVVEIPQRRAYALRATSVDGAGYSNTFIGAGERVQAPDIPMPDWYRMSHAHHGTHDMHDTHDMHGAHDMQDAHEA